MRDFRVFRVLFTPDLELDEARGVAEHGGRVALGYSHQGFLVNGDYLVVYLWFPWGFISYFVVAMVITKNT